MHVDSETGAAERVLSHICVGGTRGQTKPWWKEYWFADGKRCKMAFVKISSCHLTLDRWSERLLLALQDIVFS